MTTSTGHKESAMNINAAEFKAKCLKLIDEVAATHEPLVITKRGKPVARVVPIEDEKPRGLFGYMKGTVTIHGDIIDVPHEPWAAETGEEDDLYGPVLTNPPAKP
jgi:prevent-host-death family protein